jgi:hypothetical protein
MLKAITLPPERAVEALSTLQSLVDLSTQQLEMCTQVLEELEFSGELQKDFMKRMTRIQSDVRKARARLKNLATPQDAN